MVSRRMMIGTVMGTIILSIGIASFITNIGLREFTIDETYENAASISPYNLRAPEGTVQSLTVVAESFETLLRTPENQNEAAPESHTRSKILEWTHGPGQASLLNISNTGPGSLSVNGTLYSETDWVYLTYNFFVMISGLVIIGFSAGFGRRKPRGF